MSTFLIDKNYFSNIFTKCINYLAHELVVLDAHYAVAFVAVVVFVCVLGLELDLADLVLVEIALVFAVAVDVVDHFLVMLVDELVAIEDQVSMELYKCNI